MTVWPELLLAFVIGACVGSFLNVCITRWPHDLSVVSPRSRCPRCERPIAAIENIPIVSWLVLRGKCRGCGLPISTLYPAIELLTALGWSAAFLTFGATFTAVRVAVLGTILLGIAVTDARHYLIPDGFTVFGLVWVFVTALVGTMLNQPSPFADPYDSLIGACAGAGAIAIAGWLGEVALKKEAMGFGDVTLMAVIGAAVGPGRALLVVFVGALIGVVGFVAVVYPLSRLRRTHRTPQLDLALGDGPRELPHVPFGVFLAPAALATLLWGYDLIGWYSGRLTG
ncbi:MAG TPA: prepilin peptidase [Gemmatimonadaceae bacterium]|nr:prepilin peptidase [Gemmatimonadaceae bacterium]